MWAVRILCVLLSGLAALASICSLIIALVQGGIAWEFVTVSLKVLGVVLVVFWVLWGRVLEGPVIALRAHELLDLQDDGRVADWVSAHTIIAANSNLTGVRAMAVAADGCPSPKLRAYLNEREVAVTLDEPGHLRPRLRVDFRAALKMWRLYRYVTECRYVETFTGNREYFFVQKFHPAIRMILQVRFPANRNPKHVWAEHERGGLLQHLGSLAPVQGQGSDRLTYTWRGWFAPVGSVYYVHWTWDVEDTGRNPDEAERMEDDPRHREEVGEKSRHREL